MMKNRLQTEEERGGHGTTPNQECAKMKPITLPSGPVRRRFPAVDERSASFRMARVTVGRGTPLYRKRGGETDP
jgi:hypothetical protein